MLEYIIASDLEKNITFLGNKMNLNTWSNIPEHFQVILIMSFLIVWKYTISKWQATDLICFYHTITTNETSVNKFNDISHSFPNTELTLCWSPLQPFLVSPCKAPPLEHCMTRLKMAARETNIVQTCSLK